MTAGRTLRKTVSVIKHIQETSEYHYGKNRLAFFRYLYYAIFRLNRFHIFEKDLSTDSPPFYIKPPFHVEIKADADELRRICDDHHLPRECYYADILGLQLCFLLYHGDEIAAFSWVSFPGDYSRFFKLNKTTAEIYYITTLPKFRGRGLASKMPCHICRHLRDAGYRKAVIVIHEENKPSAKSVLNNGFKKVRTVVSIGPFNRKIRC